MLSSYRCGDVAGTVNALLLLAQRTFAINDREQLDKMQVALGLGAGTELNHPLAHDVLQAILVEQSGGARARMARIAEIYSARCAMVPWE